MDRASYIFEKIVKEGVEAIDSFIENAASEELFLDFKCSSDRGENSKLSKEDLNNFGKAISGFGNSEGGVIIWGVKCDKKEDGADVAHTKQPIHKPLRFVSWLEGNTSNRTLPAHPLVRNHPIVTANEAGYVVTLIQKSDYAPHQEINSLHYYMRSGSSFVKVPHGILAGMFGSRPEPKIGHDFLISPAEYDGKFLVVKIGIMLSNQGRGIANSLYLNADTFSSPGEITVKCPNPKDWNSRFLLGMCYHAIANNDFKIPPRARTCAINIELLLIPPFTEELNINVSYGAEGDHTHHFEIKASRDTVAQAYEELMIKIRNGTANANDRLSFSQTILGATINK